MAEKILLTSKTCGYCGEARRLLKKNKIRYRELDVETNVGEKMADKHDVRAVPTMIINGKKVDDARKWFRK